MSLFGRRARWTLPAIRIAAGLACLSMPAALASDDAAPSGPNLVVNPSFERPDESRPLPAAWYGPPQVYRIDKEVVRTGAASLEYVNDDPERYSLASQKVPLEPGRKYQFSVWVKTKDIAGPESGATISIEWQGKDGKWLGGLYPSGVKGTRDWTQAVSITRVPKEAASFTVLCYVRKGMTGTAWFDDVEVVRIVDPPMRTTLLSPGYRGRITAAGPDTGRARVRLDLVDYDYQPQGLRIHASLRHGADGEVLWETETQPASDVEEPTDLAFPTGQLAVGEYDLQVRLLGPNGDEIQKATHRLVRVPDDFQPRSTIDEHRRLVVDGKPFFPIGMYWSSINEEDVKVYAQSKFNCLMPYGSPKPEQMDLAAKHGLKVIYSVKDWYAGSRYCPGFIKSVDDEEPRIRERVRQFRDYPALLAWYLNDELPQRFMPQLEAHQRWVAEEDPHHPTWVVLYQYRDVDAYLNTFDVIGTDPYPIGRSPASMAAQWTAETFRQVERARPMWQVPQLHNWANYRKGEAEDPKLHTPTFDEVRSMAWQCIAEGATGLVFYSWYDVKRNPDVSFDVQWDGLKRVAAEIDSLAPVLLSIDPVPEIQVACDPAPADGPGWLNWTARTHAGKLYLVAVNNGDGEGQVTFTLPGAPRSVHVVGEDRSITPQGASFRGELGKLSVRIYEVELRSP
ncbi:MAG TPA: hypothetical protein VMY37_03725 [Thermoguttaceae bacterium]|nr:hypothetical protein [Thermoguttaceae bacterium]